MTITNFRSIFLDDHVIGHAYANFQTSSYIPYLLCCFINQVDSADMPTECIVLASHFKILGKISFHNIAKVVGKL